MRKFLNTFSVIVTLISIVVTVLGWPVFKWVWENYDWEYTQNTSMDSTINLGSNGFFNLYLKTDALKTKELVEGIGKDLGNAENQVEVLTSKLDSMNDLAESLRGISIRTTSIPSQIRPIQRGETDPYLTIPYVKAVDANEYLLVHALLESNGPYKLKVFPSQATSGPSRIVVSGVQYPLMDWKINGCSDQNCSFDALFAPVTAQFRFAKPPNVEALSSIDAFEVWFKYQLDGDPDATMPYLHRAEKVRIEQFPGNTR